MIFGKTSRYWASVASSLPQPVSLALLFKPFQAPFAKVFQPSPFLFFLACPFFPVQSFQPWLSSLAQSSMLSPAFLSLSFQACPSFPVQATTA
jgi:hypothetical protein